MEEIRSGYSFLNSCLERMRNFVHPVSVDLISALARSSIEAVVLVVVVLVVVVVGALRYQKMPPINNTKEGLGYVQSAVM